jgi:GMP reductase
MLQMNNKSRLLKYSDIVLTPRLSKIESRSQIDVSCKFGNQLFNLPVVPANMKTVINDELAKTLSDAGYFYIMHRFNMSNYRFVTRANKENWKTISISVGVKPSDIEALERIAYDDLRVDYITIDIAHGHSMLMKNTIAEIKENFGDKTFIIAGNVATSDAVKEITDWGADAIKVGIGQGSPCTTKDKTGFTMPMFSCMLECAKNADIPLIADGGVKCNGDVAKAMCAGADMVMVGGMFAECVNSPAENITKTLQTGFFTSEAFRPTNYKPEYKDVCYKRYYGSASQYNKGHDKNIEGVMREVPCNELSYLEKLDEMTMDLQSSVSYAGGNNLNCLANVNYLLV